MLELKNKNKFPVQVVIRSKRATRSLTVLNIPGIGSNKNTFLLEDERSTDYVDRAQKEGLISVKQI